MCLDHVYIVLEPVGSAHLTFDDDLYYELCVLMTEVCSESRMRSRMWRGVSKWYRRKDSYIGRLYSDIRKVPSDSSIFWSTGELQEFTGRSNGPYWAIRGKKKAGQGEVAPPPWVQIGLGEGAAPTLPFPTPSLLPSLQLLKGKGFLQGHGSPSRSPYT